MRTSVLTLVVLLLAAANIGQASVVVYDGTPGIVAEDGPWSLDSFGHVWYNAVEEWYRFALHEPSPNPFNPQTTIRFEVPSATQVDLSIHDVSGQLVRMLLDCQHVPAGENVVVWDGISDDGRWVVSGIYYVRLASTTFDATRCLVLLR